MNKVLINFAHPAKSHSKINRALIQAVEDLTGVTVNDLYANYPDFMIDVSREQDLCESHEIIIFQHPMYWYSTPAIVKEWLDLVLEHGWAYGSMGKALEGKLFIQALSAGGDSNSYQEHGANNFTMRELTSPMQAMANLCGMRWLPPFAVLGIHRGLPSESVAKHAEDYRSIVTALRDGNLDFGKIEGCEFTNSHLDHVIGRA